MEVILWTHKINGLSEADFVFAAKTELLAEEAPGKREEKAEGRKP